MQKPIERNFELCKKKAVGINVSPEVVDYLKGVAGETGAPYQKLIDLYLPRLREEAQETDHEVGGVAVAHH